MTLPSPLGTPEQNIKPLPEDEDSEDEALTRYIHPDLQGAQVQEEESPPQSTCGWHECGLTFRRLEELVNHIHSAHVGTSKSTYRCMWEGCNLYGVTRTSRFALIGHIRSHTGERPFTCKLPECDKSFTRSDALTKHMRVVHGMETQFPKSNQQKKRKREDSDAEEEPFVAPDSNGEDDDAGDYDEDDAYNPRGRKGRGRRGKAAGHAVEANVVPVKVEGQQPPAIAAAADVEPEVSDPESDEFLPDEVDPITGLVNGCRPSKARYLICKAKYRYGLGEHERLLETLKWLQEETQRLRLSKDEALDDLLKKQYGDELASSLLRPSIEKAPRVS